MLIGVPKEIKQQEFRVAMPPSGAYQLVRGGHRVLVERHAGAGAGFPDADYLHLAANRELTEARAYPAALREARA